MMICEYNLSNINNNFSFTLLSPTYNGGGVGFAWDKDFALTASGGGATHMASVSGLLSSLKENQDSIY